MARVGWGSFYPCEYCEYQVENAYLFDADINGGCFALCAWCWDYCIESTESRMARIIGGQLGGGKQIA